jgi:hypothetical protein
MHCSVDTLLDGVVFESSASFIMNLHYRDDHGATSVTLFDKDGNLVADDRGGVAPSPGSVMNISAVVAPEYEQVNVPLRDSAGDTINLSGWWENWPIGIARAMVLPSL